jgi:DNA-directed RNA polymerase subunit beta'
MVNAALPRDLRDYRRVLNKKSLSQLLRELAIKHPDKYREVSHKLSNIGWQAAYTSGGQSFGLRHLRVSAIARKRRAELQTKLQTLVNDDSLTDEARDEKIVTLAGALAQQQEDEVFEEQLAAGNPLAKQVLSGSRGNKMNLASLLASDLLYTDHRGRVIPFPVLRSYSQGLTPAEYWAGAYGARKGVIDLKMATQDAGFLSKQLNQAVHRNLVTAVDIAEDIDEDTNRPNPKTLRGLPVDTDDVDNEGALLARGVGGYRRNQTLTPKILEDLIQRGIKRILVRSPSVGGPADGGVYARDVGVREFGRLPVLGENVALGAAQALSEPLTQAQISSKHSGGVVTASAAKAISGFDHINQLIQVPKVFKGGAAHSEQDGTVQMIEDAPAGGYYVTVNGQKHYVGSGYELKVKQGDRIEAGDVLSEGTPNPALIVKHKGIGEGRRYFIRAFRSAYRDAGLPGHRRNIELLARGLINHVRMTEEAGDLTQDDVVPYTRLEHTYKPRSGFRTVAPKAAVGAYLERPYLHYTIGTRIRPSMLQDFDEFGVKRLDVHDDPPPFEAEMIRGMSNLQHDPDWITRMYGSGLQKSVLQATHRGGVSDPMGTSFVPGLAQSVDFGRTGKVITPKRASLEFLREKVRERKKPRVTLQELRDRVRKSREEKTAPGYP